MVYKLVWNTENKWCRPGGYKPVVKVLDGAKYIDGEEAAERDPSERLAAYHRTTTIPASKSSSPTADNISSRRGRASTRWRLATPGRF